MKKILALLTMFVMFFVQIGGAALATSVGPGTTMSFSTMLDKLSDPDTSNHTLFFNDTTLENGRMWGDKSVNRDSAPVHGIDGSVITSVPTEADEFIVTLSALSQAYEATVPAPIDAVFVLGVSGSMVEQGNEVDGESRLAVMADALNEAIRILMEANPDNRVAVVSFGGQHGNKVTDDPRPYRPAEADDPANLATFDDIIRPSRVNTILELGAVTIPSDGKVFTVSSRTTTANPNTDGPILLEVSSEITENVTTRTVYAAGGTPTARGIYRGASILANRTDTTVEVDGITLKRHPNIILMTDGDPTLGYSTFSNFSANNPYFTQAGNQWWNQADLARTFDDDLGHDMGNSVRTDLGIDLMTILTAAYWEKQVSTTYGVNAGFYTIGLGLEAGANVSKHALAILDPANNAGLISQTYDGQTYSLANLLQQFVSTPGATVEFPAIERNTVPNTALTETPLRRLQTVTNNAYLTSYHYTDMFISADSASDLTDAFTNIAETILKKAEYATAVDPEHPEWDGHVVFSDVIGEYMEFGRPISMWVDDQERHGRYWAHDMITGGARRQEFIQDNFMHYQLPGITFTEEELEDLSNPKVQAAMTAFSDMINASVAGGTIFYNPDGTYGNAFLYYTNRDRQFLGSYFDADGNVAPPPAGATAYVRVYMMSGDATDQVTGELTNLYHIALHVVTALEAGYFEELYSDGTTHIRFLEAGQQVVRWYIPGNLVPLRRVTPVMGTDGPTAEVEVLPASPIRYLYTVQLREGLQPEQIAEAYRQANMGVHSVTGTDGVYLYTNDWHKEGATPANYDNTSKYFFHPNVQNPFYFFTIAEKMEGSNNIWLWVESNSFRPAAPGDTGPFFTRLLDISGSQNINNPDIQFWDSNGNGVDDAFIPVDGSLVKPNADGTPVIVFETGLIREPFIYQAELKTANPTETNPYMKKRDGFIGETEDGPAYIVTHLLGNNGRVIIPFTEVTVEKEWLNEEITGEPVFIQLYADGEPLGTPIKLTAQTENGRFVARYTWTDLPVFPLTADANGNVRFIRPLAKPSIDKLIVI